MAEAITWGAMKSWADQNGITDDYVMEDENGDPIVDLSTDLDDDTNERIFVVQQTYG